jgi:hypothetical protein
MWPFSRSKDNRINKNVSEKIEKFGWQFQFVFDENGEKQDFVYTIGFEESFKHPEIMIFGLKKETMHSILSDISEDLRNGQTINPNVKNSNILSGEFEVMFKPLKEKFYSELAGIASRYYDKPFRVYIMLWPDKNNILPTEDNCILSGQNEVLAYV